MNRLTSAGTAKHLGVLLLSLLFVLMAGICSAEVIMNQVIVKYATRPDSMSVSNGDIYTGNMFADALLNQQYVESAEFLWKAQIPERTLLSRCLLISFSAEKSSAGMDSLKQSLKNRAEIQEVYGNSHLDNHSDPPAPVDLYFSGQWNLHNLDNNSDPTGVDIDWWRGVWASNETFPGDVIVAIIDDSGPFKYSFDAPATAGSGDLIAHEDYVKDNWWFNDDEDVTPEKEFTEADLDEVDSDGDGFLDDVIGWDFSSSETRHDDPHDVLPSCDVGDGMVYWETGPYTGSEGNPFPHTLADHGVRVIGIIAAHVNNPEGSAGITGGIDNIKIMPLKNGVASGTTATAVSALTYATQKGADVINMSWGDDSISATDAALMDSVLTECHISGVVLVASAANEENSTGPFLSHLPGTHEYTISVAATTEDDLWREDSCYNTRSRPNYPDEYGVDIAAPGSNIWTFHNYYPSSPGLPCVTGFDYVQFNKTSAAAPHVSAAAALLVAHDPTHFDGSPDAVKYRLTRSAQKIDSSVAYTNGVSEKLGHGRLNLFYMLNYVEPATSSVTLLEPDLTTVPTIVCCPGDTLDNIKVRMDLKDEFNCLVTNHPDTLAKMVEFKADGYQTVSVDTYLDSLLQAHLSFNGFPNASGIVYSEKIDVVNGQLEVEIKNPTGWGEIEIIGHVVDSAENRMKADNDPNDSNTYIEGSFFHAEFANSVTVMFTTVDLDADDDVDITDWALFAATMNTQSGDPNYTKKVDYDADDDIDIADQTIFMSHFGH